MVEVWLVAVDCAPNIRNTGRSGLRFRSIARTERNSYRDGNCTAGRRRNRSGSRVHIAGSRRAMVDAGQNI